MCAQKDEWACNGAREVLTDACAELGLENLLFVTDAHLAAMPEMAGMIGALAVDGLGVHVQAVPVGPPTTQAAEALAEAVRERKADGIVALGGGTVMDLARTAAILAPSEGRKAADFALCRGATSLENAKGTQAEEFSEESVLPLIALPTTLAGAETSIFAFLVDPEKGHRIVIRNDNLAADAVLLDPELTRGLSLELFKANVLLALAHILETAFASQDEARRKEACSLREALKKLIHVLSGMDTVDHPQALEVMKLASLAGGLSERQFGELHALAAHLSLRYHGHYGTLIAILLPFYLERLAEAGVSRGMATKQVKQLVAAAEEAEDLRNRLGLATRLSEVAVRDLEMPTLTADPLVTLSPWSVGEEAMRQIVHAAS